MTDDLAKIVPLSEEMGISYKTIYNWVKDGRLDMKRPGFVSRSEAWEVFDHMQEKRIEISYFMSAFGMSRDSSGRFIKDGVQE